MTTVECAQDVILNGQERHRLQGEKEKTARILGSDFIRMQTRT